MNDEPAPGSDKASRTLRDRVSATRSMPTTTRGAPESLSADLRSCSDILPRSVCVSLGLPTRRVLRGSRNDYRRVMTSASAN